MRLPCNIGSVFRWNTLLLLGIWAGCQVPGKEERFNGPYFDLKDFVTEEAGRLNNGSVKANKTIVLDGKSETKRGVPVNWMEELEPLLECDINSPALADAFSIDTTETNGSMQLSYLALQPDTKVRQLHITLEGNTCKRIRAVVQSESRLYGLTRLIAYDRDQGFFMEGSRQVKGLETSEYHIKTLFE